MLCLRKFGQKCDRLNVNGVPKLINRSSLCELISASAEFLQITGKGRRITAYINYACRRKIQHSINGHIIKSLARRINNDNINRILSSLRFSAVRKCRQYLFRTARLKEHILNAVAFCVDFCVTHCLGYYFDTINLTCLLRHKERYCADSAVKIKHIFRSGQSRIRERDAVKFLRLFGIHLVEGKRRNAEQDLLSRRKERKARTVDLVLKFLRGLLKF